MRQTEKQTQIAIRPATAADRHILSELKWRASWTNLSDRPFLALNEDAARTVETADLAVVTEGGAIRGYVATRTDSNRNLAIEGLFVDPDHMRRGFGRLLADHAVALAYEDGAEAIVTDANPSALAFYTELGFEEDRARQGAGRAMRLEL